MSWEIDGVCLQSHLILGTARYPSPEILMDAINQSQAQLITVSVRRESAEQQAGLKFWELLKKTNCHFLPNTAGCRNAKEAVTTAKMAREIFATSWIKLEVIGDDYNLQPDPFELVTAAQALIKEGFTVFPYCTDDLVLCQKLVESGCDILMPWAAPIGTAQGIINPMALKTLRARFPQQHIVIDAGIGAPSHAALAMEMGFDAILVNSAVALSSDPVLMAQGFAQAVEAGSKAYQAGLLPPRDIASPSTPTIGTPFWHQQT